MCQGGDQQDAFVASKLPGHGLLAWWMLRTSSATTMETSKAKRFLSVRYIDAARHPRMLQDSEAAVERHRQATGYRGTVVVTDETARLVEGEARL